MLGCSRIPTAAIVAAAAACLWQVKGEGLDEDQIAYICAESLKVGGLAAAARHRSAPVAPCSSMTLVSTRVYVQPGNSWCPQHSVLLLAGLDSLSKLPWNFCS
jgi:hypothetical protein